MMVHSPLDSTNDPEFDRILSECIEVLETGEVVSIEDWERKYPRYANQLRELIEEHRRLDAVVPRGAAVEDRNQRTVLGVASSTDRDQAESGRVRYFGDYELIEEIARGGMGVVYRGRQSSLNRPVAVKMILAGALASAEDVARFRLEAEAAASLDHPGIVPIHEIGEFDGQHYFSMKFISGESLSARCGRMAAESDKLGPTCDQIRQSAKLVAEIARAVHYAHQRGIIHRDLKPANILLDGDGRPHITDFGLAKRIAGQSQLTHSGAIVGTPSFMSPEQARGQGEVTTATDIYGLGAILYATLTGRSPFDESTPLETLKRVVQDSPTRPSLIAARVDRDLESICLTCLEKDPDLRYRSAGELADDLDRWWDGDPVRAAQPRALSLFWRWLTTNFRAAISLLAFGLAVGWLVGEFGRGTQAHNVGNYLGVYRNSFPTLRPPAMLEAIAAYPIWLTVITTLLGIFSYFSMGWLADRIVLPKSAATAILVGLGLGSAAAVTAFFTGIGWVTLSQVAIWPAQPDLELLAAQIDGDTSFTGGRKITEVYPGVPARQVLKKALVDMQSALPMALVYGLLYSVGLLVLPAALQTLAVYCLRLRGEGGWLRFMHLLEISIPASMLLLILGFLSFEQPGVVLALLGTPVLAGFGTEAILRRHPTAAPRVYLCLAAAGALLTVLNLELLFSPATTHGFSLGLFVVGSVTSIVAVFQRWHWAIRLLTYVIWFATLIAGGLVVGSLVGENARDRMSVCIAGSLLVAVVGVATTWRTWVKSHALSRATP